MATSQPLTRTRLHRSTCPRCFGGIANTPTEQYCPDCGLVIEADPLDHTRWGTVSSDAEEEQERATGMEVSDRVLQDRGLGSVRDSDPGGADEQRRDTLHQRARNGDKKDRNRGYATTEIHRMTHALDLPEYVGDRAKRLFCRVHDARSLVGTDLDTIAAACLHLACRRAGLGRTAGDIAPVARADEHAIQRRLLWVADAIDAEVPPPDAVARTRVVAGRLDASVAVTQAAIERVRQAPADGTAPSTLAAAALYDAGPWTQAEVAEAAGCTPTGLRKCAERVAV